MNVKIKVKKGRKGLIGGYSNNGKVILIDRNYLPSVKEGEEYICSLIEKNRFCVATNLKLILYGWIENKDEKFYFRDADSKKLYPLESKILEKKLYFYDRVLYNKYIYNVNIPENFIVYDSNNEYYILKEIANFKNVQGLNEFKKEFKKYVNDIKLLDKKSQENYHSTLEWYQKKYVYQNQKSKIKQKFLKKDYKDILNYLIECQKIRKYNNEINIKVRPIEDTYYKLMKEIEKILEKYTDKKFQQYEDFQFVVPIPGNLNITNERFVVIVNFIRTEGKVEVSKVFQKWEKVKDREINEDGDEFIYEFETWVTKDKADFDIPLELKKDITKLSKLYSKWTKAQKEINELEKKLKIEPILDFKAQEMLEMAIKKTAKFLKKRPQDVTDKEIIDFLLKEHIPQEIVYRL